ncbi:MAG: 50S ribosomal protein L20 [Candidatus Magasanikbacteria bacterium RIFCSPHIGHO2_01_FULL_50_8]|uniref:50S ribosomal protein L20 n=2 Tax=Candidatus Magasanikiibacteriota TaxID=1752731 RepID=A0A1F6LR20_9BACT|nr:MAG: 50S ribosomal protein L20 [Candidatus Magasanikbacteria bacterium RIFCSPHIGHO2_01_FULL_50_8]OGH67947.1 MAG: 50S ribosomal protein L20 [Candidatus Magasanikbacteria bacterium RIFCSPHIGHO2_02_FULL_50_9b]
MPRVKRGTIRARKRTKLLKHTKGYLWGRKNRVKVAKEAILHAGVNAMQDRRKKKAVARGGWHIVINAAVREYGMSYSKFMGALKKSGVTLNRKVLAELAQKYPKVFEAVVQKVK